MLEIPQESCRNSSSGKKDALSQEDPIIALLVSNASHCSMKCYFEVSSLSVIFFFLRTHRRFLSCERYFVRMRCTKMVPIHDIPVDFRFQVSRSSHRKKLYLISCYRSPSRLYDFPRPFDWRFTTFGGRCGESTLRLASPAPPRCNRHHRALAVNASDPSF